MGKRLFTLPPRLILLGLLGWVAGCIPAQVAAVHAHHGHGQWLGVAGHCHLMRGGVVAFGQGLMAALGGYAPRRWCFNQWGWHRCAACCLLGGLCHAWSPRPFAPLLARYRGIFFSMLTLALSMVMYGILVKTESLGGSDGFNMGRVTLLGQALPDRGQHTLLSVTLAVLRAVSLVGGVFRIHARLGHARDSRQRIARRVHGRVGGATMAINFVLAAFLGGMGGAWR
jgi:ABC-type branched-subunit amino acid transport system permease subunit